MLRQERSGHHSVGRKRNFISCCDIQCQNLTRHYTTTTTTQIFYALMKLELCIILKILLNLSAFERHYYYNYILIKE